LSRRRSADPHISLQLRKIPIPRLIVFFDIVSLPSGNFCAFQRREVLRRRAEKQWSRRTGDRIIIFRLCIDIQFLVFRYMKVCSCSNISLTCAPLSSKVPMPGDNGDDVKDIVADHDDAFPDLEFAVGQKDQTKGGGRNEEGNIADETPSGNVEWSHNCHGSRHNSSYKARSSKQLAHCHAAAVRAHRRKG
jgi:hypothetical protein